MTNSHSFFPTPITMIALACIPLTYVKINRGVVYNYNNKRMEKWKKKIYIYIKAHTIRLRP